MIHDRPHHLAQRRITYLLRRALGDLFLGPELGMTGGRQWRQLDPPSIRSGPFLDDGRG
jgi:hypothetical protein